MKKTVKRALSALCCTAVLLSALCFFAAAETEITDVTASVTGFAAGNAVSTTGAVTTDDGYTVSIHEWFHTDNVFLQCLANKMNDTNVFEAGESYVVGVCFTPVWGNTLAQHLNATVEGSEGKIGEFYGSSRIFYVVVSLPESGNGISFGSCGENVTWTLNVETGDFSVTGSGEMDNYLDSSAVPWRDHISDIRTVTIEKGVTSIGNSSFENCTALTSVAIPDSVTAIGDHAFCNCIALKSVTIPDNVKIIRGYAFHSCGLLTSIEIPAGVTSIGASAFVDCYGLTRITVKSGNTAFSAKDGVLYNKKQTTLLCYPAGKTERSFRIPDSVTKIGETAFGYCRRLEIIMIPLSVTSMERYAFWQSAVKDVYYAGSKFQWKKIAVDKQYECLPKGTMHYNRILGTDDASVFFKDIKKNAWYGEAVNYVVDRGIFSGSNGKFDPNGEMTRAMFVSVLARLAGVIAKNDVKTGFSDVPAGKWYSGAVKWASDNDIVSGANGKFMPNDPITREQICAIFVTYAKYKKITLTSTVPAVAQIITQFDKTFGNR